jgi:hypothetical protein
MPDAVWINNFPMHVRGTYRIKSDGENTESEKLELAKGLIEEAATEAGITVLLDAKMQGNGWILLWWPASEPRHQETDQIINGE